MDGVPNDHGSINNFWVANEAMEQQGGSQLDLIASI
jgi:hypothetical protein